MGQFSFHPELFEQRTNLMAALSEAGFEWYSHYGAVEVDHERYGVRVTGIHRDADADEIEDLLWDLYPDWDVQVPRLREDGREPGWRIGAFRDPPRDRDSWQTA